MWTDFAEVLLGRAYRLASCVVGGPTVLSIVFVGSRNPRSSCILVPLWLFVVHAFCLFCFFFVSSLHGGRLFWMQLLS